MFGEKLKSLRESKGLTQQQLADLMKVGRSTIAGYETKGIQPDFEKLVWISSYFGVSTDYLLDQNANEVEQPEYDEHATKTPLVAAEDTVYNKICISEDEIKILHYYNRLNDENKDYIKGRMVELYKEEQYKRNSPSKRD